MIPRDTPFRWAMDKYGKFERRGRKGFAEDAKEDKATKSSCQTFQLPLSFWAIFCALCVTFALFAFKNPRFWFYVLGEVFRLHSIVTAKIATTTPSDSSTGILMTSISIILLPMNTKITAKP
jgi:hypothetical protein